MQRARRGFGLLEVAFAVMIVSVALLGLNAAVSGAIDSAADSINRRAAREQCRAKLEEILAGVTPPDGGGELEDYPEFRWTSRTEELQLGVPEYASETVKVVIVELEFPSSAASAGGGGGDKGPTAAAPADEGTQKITLASVLEETPPQ